jgi:hypothetical protein
MFQPPVDARLRREQADLNYAFIDLVARIHRERVSQPPVPILGLRPEWAASLYRMRHRKRREIAECAFALYGLRLNDAQFWGSVRTHHVPDDYAGVQAPCGPALEQRLIRFSLTALMHAWYLACSNEYGARLLLGVPQSAVRRLAAMPVTLLEKVALASPSLLHARLTANRRFWPDVIACVDHGSKQQRFAAKLLGAQLIAASSALAP